MSDVVRTNPEYAWRMRSRTVLGEPELTAEEVATAAGASIDEARRLWRALGFPPVPDDRPFFTRSDVAILAGVRAFVEQGGAEPEVLLQLTRTTGQALARLAEAHVSATMEHLERTTVGTPTAVDEALWAAIDALAPTFEPFLAHVWRRHLVAATWRRTLAALGGEDVGGALVVGFADLVGFTAATLQLDERELATMVDRFEALVFEHVPRHQGRVVKMIGDEVMFCTERAPDAVEIALSLVEAHHRDETVPDIRVGLAMGPTLSWQGDLFGPTVNRASRVVDLARPASVLVSDELADALRSADGYVLRELRPLRLRGIGRVRLHAVRRAPRP